MIPFLPKGICTQQKCRITRSFYSMVLFDPSVIRFIHPVQRFLPSEFGTDPARMENAMEPGRITFDDKMVVRRAIQDAGIPFTYVSANCFAGYFLGGLCQPGHIIPSRDHVTLLGDGNQKGNIYIFMSMVMNDLINSFLITINF